MIHRRTVLRIFAVAGLMPPLSLLSGCPKPGETPRGDATPAGSGGGKPGAKAISVGLVTDVGGIDDKSFNAQAWAGLQEAKEKLGANVKFVESKQNADYVKNLSQFAKKKYDLVIAVGFLMKDAVASVASDFPDVKFMLIDGDAPDSSNACAYKFREEEGSFLAGALAGLMTKTGTIGFVGGMEMPLIAKFECGFQAGALTVKPDIQVRVGYVGSFDDTQKGAELAQIQLASRADILYHAAGKAGIGVIKTVADKGAGFYAIGVDSDQDSIAPGRVLTSMVKRVDRAVFDVCERVATHRFESGTVVLGLKDDAVGLSVMTHTKKDIPEAVLAKIESLKKDIVDGKIKPPSTRELLDLYVKKQSESP